jgi:hypothetical protein
MTESTTRQVRQVIDHLRHDFPTIPEPELEGVVIHEFREFHDARFREYLPVIVERRLRGQLRPRRAS